MATLFISDLHLTPERPDICGAFLTLLRDEALRADALFILGDLFEIWIGDDACLPDYPKIVSAMKALTTAGVPLYIQTGNRDFLLGKEFCAATGAELLDDEFVINLYGKPTLVMHGDQLCTDDHDYQRWRRFYKKPFWQRLFLALPTSLRRRIGLKVRSGMSRQTQRKPMEIMDVNPYTVAEYMAWHGVRTLIHGHTHRPAIHDIKVAGNPAKRVVLGDWYEQGSVYRVGKQKSTLLTLSFFEQKE